MNKLGSINAQVQEHGETVKIFVTALCTLAEYCEYGTLHDELIRDRIVIGIRDAELSQQMQF